MNADSSIANFRLRPALKGAILYKDGKRVRMNNNFLTFYVPCSESFLNSKLAELSTRNWTRQDLENIKQVWEQIKSFNESASDNKPSIEVSSWALENAIRLDIIQLYFSRFAYRAFEGRLELSSPFKPYPTVPLFFGKDGKIHFLWVSLELKEILLQLWLYCNQDESRFTKAVEKVWQQYRQYSRNEAGYRGEADKLAAALRDAADSV